MNYNRFKLANFVLLTLLTGCTALNADFECKMKPGVRCKSLNEVNQLVDTKKSTTAVLEKKLSYNSKILSEDMSDIKNSSSINEESTLLRTSEKVLAIWLAPFEDASKRYHSAHTVYSIREPGHWMQAEGETP